jgi:hypothetical protein
MRTPARGLRPSRTYAVSVGASFLAFLNVAGAAPARVAVTPELRVEPGGAPWSGPTHYSTGTVRFPADSHPACGGSGRRRVVAGPTALGIVYDAQASRRVLRPVRTTDRFSSGDFLCGMGRLLTGTVRYWDVKVNMLTPPVGASEIPLRSRDRVLWFYVDTATGRNTGAALELRAPVRALPAQPIRVKVLAHDGAGGIEPAAGARVGGVTADADGRATISAPRRHRLVLRATRGSDVASAPVQVCLGGAGRRCPGRRGWSIVGRNRGERLHGTSGADHIDARRGDDFLLVRRGERDTVRCGGGRDTVLASDNDRVARDCERVRR